jgi:hypothetical protein
MKDLLPIPDALYQAPRPPRDPQPFHYAVLVGRFRDRVVCGKCGVVSPWNAKWQMFMDERSLAWVASEAGLAWMMSNDPDDKVPAGLHLYTATGALPEDEQEDIEREARLAAWWATHEEEKRLETLTKIARVQGYIDHTTGQLRRRTSEGTRERQARYRKRHAPEINEKRRAKRRAARAAAKAAAEGA